MARRKPLKKQGASRMREQGYRQVTLWLDANELSVIKRAAQTDGRPVATWCRRAAFDAAVLFLTQKLEGYSQITGEEDQPGNVVPE
jgi:hypothetical protein